MAEEAIKTSRQKREERESAALRENLKKRKAQQQAREALAKKTSQQKEA